MVGTKRKSEHANVNGSSKRRAISDEEAHSHFRDGLFESSTLEKYTKEYAASQPYKHGVIQGLMQPALLRSVRSEIRENLHFTPKETDIYRIHQSGDLANLDGLEDSSLARLPSLLQLRDALYSSAFRKYVAQVADSGPLSGSKTDMAINIYTPGCHLLCHDDVIGSRRVSYILYLTDPDVPWKPEWGGALRLYPTEEISVTEEHGKEIGTQKVPSPDFTVSIPPAFNQLSFFAVQPGESFHDVEEVCHASPGHGENDGGRVRMAISGWYHIPQEGEEGYEEGLDARLAEKSSLTQLQGRDSKFDLPQCSWHEYPDNASDEIQADGEEHDEELTEADLEFLLRYITPQYLTPDTVEELSTRFEDDSSLQLSNFLTKKYADGLRHYTRQAEADFNHTGVWKGWRTARPPHKHRFQYLLGSPATIERRTDPMADLVNVILPSVAFKKWLSLVTSGLDIRRYNTMSRCFRKGLDYSLATSYEHDRPQLEVCIGVTPTSGWPGEEEDADGTDPDTSKESNGSLQDKSAALDRPENVGGYEVYMAGDEEEDDTGATPVSATGAGQRRKADPAIYRVADDDEEDGVLFSNPASWNTMSIVLRDKGTLRFVKYVSKAAPGHRWDVVGEYEVEGFSDEEDEDSET